MSNRKHIQTIEGLRAYIADLQDKYQTDADMGEFGIILELKTGIRTTAQNNAMHVYYGLLGKALNDAGLDMKTVLKPEVEINWTQQSVKEYLWRPIQKAVTGKVSTRDLDRGEVSDVYETLNRHMASKFGVLVPFPDRFSR